MRRTVIAIFLFSLVIWSFGCNLTPEETEHGRYEPSGTSTTGDAAIDIEAGNTGALPQTVQPLTLLFFSDTQAEPEIEDYAGVGELLMQARSRCDMTDLIVFGGDTVNEGGSQEQWREFRKAVAFAVDGLTTAAVAGNHDNHSLLVEQFDFPAEKPAGYADGYFYSFCAGQVFFIMLDSNIMGASNQADVDWLRKELQSEEAQQAGWRIAVMHHPMWPVVDIPKDTQRAAAMQESFLPVMEEYGVELILCGHQHVYSRTLPMSGSTAVTESRGIVQIMAASGDKSPYIAGGHDYIAAHGCAPNYLMLTADAGRIVITAFDAGHNVIDSAYLLK